MAGTFNIPLTTFGAGDNIYPATGVADADSKVVLSIDRTVANGFNSQPTSTTAEITAEQSNDGGITWFLAVAGTVQGGQYFRAPPPRGDGSLITTSTVQVNLYPGKGRQVRARLTVAGAPGVSVVIAGTLTVS